jgi:arylsulfatase A-like enzyme
MTNRFPKKRVLPLIFFVSLSVTVLIVALVIERRAEATRQSRTAKRPNIIIIMSDDMGYSDIGGYGGEIDTPNLDALARGGVRFTQFYNNARCCPTRAALLTGLYPHQAGIGHMMEDRGADGYRGDLSEHCVTIAEALKPAGYSTYAVGKWHVTPGNTPERLTRTRNWPLQRGFERYYGTIHGAGSFFDPSSLVRDNTLITAVNDPEYRPAQFYYTDAISDHAQRFIADHAQKKGVQPFFMYVAYTAAHWPMHALEKDVAKYKGKYDAGYAPVRRARYERMKKMGLIDARWDLSPPAEDWNEVKNKEWEARTMEVYAAMIDNMDQGIGRIVAELKKRGQLDNTLIFYLQDNGACAEPMGRRPNATNKFAARSDKPVFPVMPDDAQQYGSAPKQTRSGYPVVMGPGVMPGGPDTYIAYGRGWANVSNTPLRLYKHWVHEGGISTPLIAHWPEGIDKSLHRQFIRTPGHLIDLMATCIDLSGARYPKERNGSAITPMAGVSLAPALKGKSIDRGKPIFWEHEGNRAIREGKWKLVAQENQPWELYDIEADRAELHNLALEHPKRVKEMAVQWDTWAAKSMVTPLGAWRHPVVNTGGNQK